MLTNAQKAESLREEIRHRASAARLLWRQLTRKKPVELPPITTQSKISVVTLTGKMDSGAERALAIELAQNVRGVKSVNSNSLTM